MPDISMCINFSCKKRLTCYRYLAIPNERQSYADFTPDEDGNCDGFMNCHEFRRVRKAEDVDAVYHSQEKDSKE